jgi:hypothetical protein
VVFYYGLYMDTSLLASRGIIPSRAIVGYADGYGIRIGRSEGKSPEERKLRFCANAEEE